MDIDGTAESTTPESNPEPDTVTEESVTVTETEDTVTESPEESADPLDSVELDLEKLISAAFDEDPIMSGEHTGLPPYQDILKHLPENGRKLIQNLRSSYTKKTQDLADMRRQLEAERNSLQQQRRLLAEGPGAKQLAAIANAEPAQFDPWSADSMEAKIKAEAAKMVQSLIQPMQEDLRLATRKQELSAFKDQHPDLMDGDMKAGVVKLLQSRPELKLEDAYYLVRGRLQEARLAQLEKTKTEQRHASRSTLRKTSTGRNVGATKAPKFDNAWDAYQYHKTNK